MKGSTINEKTASKSLSPGMKKMREKLISEKVEKHVTSEDIFFSSSSAAADFALGYSVSEQKMWRSKDGRSLKELEAPVTTE